MNTTPAAIDSPAEPVVWTMLFSRMVDLPEDAEDGDREHGDRDRRGDGHADLERQVHARRGEDDAQDGAEDHRADGQLRRRLRGWDVGFELGVTGGGVTGRVWVAMQCLGVVGKTGASSGSAHEIVESRERNEGRPASSFGCSYWRPLAEAIFRKYHECRFAAAAFSVGAPCVQTKSFDIPNLRL